MHRESTRPSAPPSRGATALVPISLAPISLAMFMWAWGCHGPHAAHPEVGPGNVVQAPADGGSVIVPPGCVLQVSLPSNPSTGYRWQVDQLPPGLAVEGESRFVPASDQPTMGGGGTEIWQFAAIEPPPSAPQEVLRLSYRRPWEKDVAPARTYEATVRIQKR